MLRTNQIALIIALAVVALISYVTLSGPESPVVDDGGAVAFDAAVAHRSSPVATSAAARALEPAPGALRERQGAESAQNEPGLAWIPLSDDDLCITGRVIDSSGAPLGNVRITTDGRDVDAADTLALAGSTENVGRAVAPPFETDAALAEALARYERELRTGRSRTRHTTSDSEGRFTLEVGAPGEDYVRASADGYDFRPVRVRTASELELVGTRVYEFELDVRLPSGEQPESAIVTTRARGGNSTSLRWTRASPSVRVPSPRLHFETFAGDLRRGDRHGQYGSEFASDMVSLNHAIDGRGPHLVTLVPRVTLTVTLASGSESSLSSAHVWAVPTTTSAHDAALDRPSSSIAIALDRDRYKAYGLETGTWIVRAGWTYQTALVERTVVVDGPVALTLELPELGGDGQLQVIVLDPEGRRLPGVRFVERWSGGSSGLGAARARDGAYWIPRRAIARGTLDAEDAEVHLGAQHEEYGTVLVALGRSTTTVELSFAPPCLLVAHVDGTLDGELEVGADLSGPGLAERGPWSMQQSGEPVDGRGVAHLPPLQPGRYMLTLRALTDALHRPHETKVVHELEVFLASGPRTARFAAPVFHDVVISAPSLGAGTRLTLKRVATNELFVWPHEGVLDASRRLVLTRVLAGDYLLRDSNAGQQGVPVRVPSGTITYEPAVPSDRR